MAVSHQMLCTGVGVLLLACMGCGDAVVLQAAGSGGTIGGSAPVSTTPLIPSATTPAVLSAVSPVVVQAGSGATRITLSATGIGAGATVLVDGAIHAATLVGSDVATVTLSAGELATGTRHSLAIQNPGLAVSNTKTVLVTAGYWAFGDSITYGAALPDPSTGNYAYLLASAYHLSLVNSARGGDQACDVWPQMYRSGAGYTRQAAPLFSLMIGTNDVDVKQTGAYETVFTACDLAAVSWLGTPRSAKLLAGDAGFAASGDCGSTAQASLLGAVGCAGGSGSITATLTTSGNPIYVWYLLSDSAASGDGIAVSLDGSAASLLSTRPVVPIATANGGTQGMGVLRLAAAAGSHTVRITAAGFAGVLGVGTNPASGADHPRLVVGDLPNQAVAAPIAPVASQLIYVGHIVDAEQRLQADGMDIHRAFTRQYMLGTNAELGDQLHPNPFGQQELGEAFDAALP